MEPLPLRKEPPRAIAARPAAQSPAQAPLPARRVETAPAQSDAAATGDAEQRGSGWLSDLLARASRDDDARGDDPVANIARNIGRYIDQDSAAGVWDRYYRGDQGVFTRKIYSTQGQLAFDEARRRYQAEQPFRDAVDHFAEEFERELQKVSRDDRDGSLIRNYLTSDDGKAYTLLAHAAGRFDGA
jgi:hypothetical protein